MIEKISVWIGYEDRCIKGCWDVESKHISHGILGRSSLLKFDSAVLYWKLSSCSNVGVTTQEVIWWKINNLLARMIYNIDMLESLFRATQTSPKFVFSRFLYCNLCVPWFLAEILGVNLFSLTPHVYWIWLYIPASRPTKHLLSFVFTCLYVNVLLEGVQV